MDDLPLVPVTAIKFFGLSLQTLYAVLDNNFLKYIKDETKFEINKNYPDYDIIHSIIKNFYNKILSYLIWKIKGWF